MSRSPDDDCLDDQNSRRSFLTAVAGLGTAAIAGFGLNSSANAQEAAAVSSQSSLDAGKAAANFLMFSGSASQFGTVFMNIRQHENAHVAFLVKALGAEARPKPTFQGIKQSCLRNFVSLARAFENTGSGAYLNAVPAIDNPEYLAAAGSIALVEARHAGFINVATTNPITLLNANFEVPIPPSAVAAAVAPYVKSLNGGPPLTYSSTRSSSNDIAILNFALALEYLEAEYYNVNVPLFY